MNTFDYLFKYIIIGDVSVGKSCIVMRYSEEKFKQVYDPTIGVEFASKNLELNIQNKTLVVKTQVWDTAGQESFKSITRNYYRGSVGGLLVFDVGNRDSFDNIKRWYNELIQVSNKHIEIVLVGNKIDLANSARQVTYDECKQFADKIGISFFECSAKIGEGIDEIFLYLSQTIINHIQSGYINPLDSYLGIKIGKRGQHLKKQKQQDELKKNNQKPDQHNNIGQCYC